MKKVLGGLLLLAPFVLVFYFGLVTIGLKAILAVMGMAALLVACVIIGVNFVFSE